MMSLVTASRDETGSAAIRSTVRAFLNQLVAHRVFNLGSVQESKDNRTSIIDILDLREDRGENTAARRRGKTKMRSGTRRERSGARSYEVVNYVSGAISLAQLSLEFQGPGLYLIARF
jgi:hypothetical protein